jgi:hypothetical protein
MHPRLKPQNKSSAQTRSRQQRQERLILVDIFLLGRRVPPAYLQSLRCQPKASVWMQLLRSSTTMILDQVVTMTTSALPLPIIRQRKRRI